MTSVSLMSDQALSASQSLLQLPSQPLEQIVLALSQSSVVKRVLALQVEDAGSDLTSAAFSLCGLG